MDHLVILIRSFSAFVILMLIGRILGKQTLSNMNFHEFVTAVILGAIAANFAFNEKIEVVHLLIALSVFTITSYVLSKFFLKFRNFKMWTEGAPTVLIEGGFILEDNLKKNNMTLDSLNQQLRQKEIFNIEEVEYALLEINGKLSVQKKKELQAVTLKDLQLNAGNATQFPIELVIDGQLLHGNLNSNHIPESWLLSQLKARDKKLEDVFYAVKGSNGQLYVDEYKDKIQHPIDVE
ncbi:DUF421 domain-containing protein [Paenibacillus sp. FSL M7-0802]|uniref:Uncharacterized membrane protein YcaP (DUF421 family) n=1 Tax=Paenibacillus peoriae TaxID=59893 RepID=A0ABU1QJ61_9BACL|nr:MULTISPECIES: DUF421 domain-containing protein [Paenibacillus]APB69769.1 DUF421 domain-containing protein [Paenibacillus polymyxa]MDR6779692.1 uncharacterized membrane protein YcaP (DUF421 family) [Paenibacillus peoriae]OMF41840.1 hypothetical protein BK135_20275 [Paenibacillus peoriae]QYK63905.1 hypothetical protein KAI37_04255 [Paenibacillus sp. S25]QYK69162.1 hypothetical protein KAI36_04332 [Paenibacillus sp. S02]